jgi:molybdopterin molybdotransferase
MTEAKSFTLRPLDEALAQLLGSVQPMAGSEVVSILKADRRVLAQTVYSQLNVPGFDNSAMDGYALRTVDCVAANTVLRVAQRIAAGQTGQVLGAGQIARIFTGAAVPQGADAVVMQEECTDLGDGTVRVNVVPQTQQCIRRVGEDIAQGAAVLPQGALLSPASLGLLASIGMATVQVARQPRVALFSTGDELATPGEVAPYDLPPGVIYNSNRFFLHALLLRAGCKVTDMGVVPDQREATVAALQAAALRHDVILTSGGVSVGEEDHIKPAVQQLGTLDLWSISMKPGKPFAYGRIGAAHFVGLPGNPVASWVTFLLLVKPMLAALQGQHFDIANLAIDVRADFAWPQADKRREFLRAKRNAQGGLEVYPNQSSGVLTSVVWADGLVDKPAGSTIAVGDTVRFIPFAHLLS